MLASQRQERILAAVRADGAARVADLVESLDVSDMTVRRDIAELARAGLVRRVHGGAVAPDAPGRPTDEPGFDAKRSWAGPEKAAIARAALATVEPGQAVALSAGTTTYLLAELLAGAGIPDLTVVTNGLRDRGRPARRGRGRGHPHRRGPHPVRRARRPRRRRHAREPARRPHATSACTASTPAG